MYGIAHIIHHTHATSTKVPHPKIAGYGYIHVLSETDPSTPPMVTLHLSPLPCPPVLILGALAPPETVIVPPLMTCSRSCDTHLRRCLHHKRCWMLLESLCPRRSRSCSLGHRYPDTHLMTALRSVTVAPSAIDTYRSVCGRRMQGLPESLCPSRLKFPQLCW